MANATARQHLEHLINLSQEQVAEGRPNRPGRKIQPVYITIHNTSNTGRGADAAAHSRMVREKGYYDLRTNSGEVKRNQVSWHFTVDDKRAIQHLPMDEMGYHAGQKGNRASVGVEVCMHKDIDQAAADLRAARLAALLMHDLGVPAENIVTHQHWTGKACPTLLLGRFDAFRAQAAAIHAESFARTPAPQPPPAVAPAPVAMARQQPAGPADPNAPPWLDGSEVKAPPWLDGSEARGEESLVFSDGDDGDSGEESLEIDHGAMEAAMAGYARPRRRWLGFLPWR